MADRRPLGTPGNIREIPTTDRTIVGGLVNPDGVMTFQDTSGGPHTLADLLAGGGGGGIGGSTGANDNRLLRSDGAGGATVQASGATLSDAGDLSGIASFTLTGNVNMSAGATIDGVDLSVHAAAVNPHSTTFLSLPDTPASYTGEGGKVVRVNAGGTALEFATVSGVGDFVGPASSVDNAIVRFSGTTGKLGQGSDVFISDDGDVTNVRSLEMTGDDAVFLNNAVLQGRGYNTPSFSVTSDQNDYNPAGWPNADVVIITPTGNRTITGAEWPSGDTTTKRKIIYNASASNTIALPHESASSASTNRWRCPSSVSIVIPPQGSVIVHYISGKWSVVDHVGAAGTGTIIGTAGATDNRIIRADGGGGNTIQASVVTIDDSGAMTGLTGVSVTGNVTVSGNVDGRDVSVDGATLDAHVASAIRHLPASLGTALQGLRVNAGATAPEWYTPDLDDLVPGTAAALQVPRRNAANTAFEWATISGGGSGDVVGPSSATDHAIARFDTTTGKLLQDSVGILTDAGALSGLATVTMSGALTSASNQAVDASGTTLQLGLSANAKETDVEAPATVRVITGGTTRATFSSASLLMGSGVKLDLLNNPIERRALNVHGQNLSAQQDNFSPTNWTTRDVLRIVLTGNQTITGFDASVGTVRKIIINADTTDTLTLSHEDAASTSTNRIVCPNGSNLAIPPNCAAVLYYDTNRWRAFPFNFGASAGSFLGLSDTPSSYTGAALQVVRVNAAASALEFAAVSGLGDVVGPASATDHALARFDLTTGKLIQNSVGILTDAGALSGIDDFTLTGSIAMSAGETVDGRDISADWTTISGHIAATNNPHGTTFVGLTDSAGAYSGQAGKFVRVKATEDGLEYATGGGGGLGGSTGATDNSILRADGAGGATVQAGSTVTLSDNGSFAGINILEFVTTLGSVRSSSSVGIWLQSNIAATLPAAQIQSTGTGSASVKLFTNDTANPQGVITAAAPALNLGGAEATQAGGKGPALWMRWDGSSADGPWSPIFAGRPALKNAIDGLKITWNTTTQVQVEVGSCMVEDTSTGQLKVVAVTSPITITSSTTGAGGRDTGGSMTTNRWYYVWLIAKHTTGSGGQDVSALISLSETAPTMPSGYTMKRRIGSVRTDGSSTSLVEQFQIGNSNKRRYYYNNSSFITLVSSGNATTNTAFGYNGSGAGGCPITATGAGVNISTNATAQCNLRPSSSAVISTSACPISQTLRYYEVIMVAGVSYYTNSTSGGSTTITLAWMEEDV